MSIPAPAHRLTSSVLPATFAFLKLNGHETEPLGAYQSATTSEDKGQRHVCYVEAIDGAAIEVGWADYRSEGRGKPDHAFVLRVSVDGQFVNGSTFILDDPVFVKLKHDPARLKFFHGQVHDVRTMKRLRLRLVWFFSDSNSSITVSEAFKSLGTIRLTYHRIRNVESVEPEYPDAVRGDTVYEPKPDEVEAAGGAAKLYATHQATTAEEIAQPKTDAWYGFDYVDPEDEPLMTFEWRYRSTPALQVMTFLPPDPPPSPSPTGAMFASTFAAPHLPTPSARLSDMRFDYAQKQAHLVAKVAQFEELRAASRTGSRCESRCESRKGQSQGGAQEGVDSDGSSVEMSEVGSFASGATRARKRRKDGSKKGGMRSGRGKGKERAFDEEEESAQNLGEWCLTATESERREKQSPFSTTVDRNVSQLLNSSECQLHPSFLSLPSFPPIRLSAMAFFPHLAAPSCMVSFPSLPELGAWIEADGQPLAVYGVETDEQERMTTAYVEARAGQRFCVKWVDLRSKAPANHYEMALLVDGIDSNGSITRKEDRIFSDSVVSPYRVATFDGKEAPSNQILPFRFTTLSQVSSGSDEALSPSIDGVGSIVLTYSRVKDVRATTGARGSSTSGSATVSLGGDTKRIGLTLATGFDAPVPRLDVEEVTAFKRVDEKGAPLSSVVFKYRSRAVLQLQGLLADDVAPLSPAHNHHPDETRPLRSFHLSSSAAAFPRDPLPPHPSLLTSQRHQHAVSPSPHHHHRDDNVSNADLDLEMQERLVEIRRLEQELAELNAVKREVEEEERQPRLKRVKREVEQEQVEAREETRYTVVMEVDGKGKKVEVLILEDE